MGKSTISMAIFNRFPTLQAATTLRPRAKGLDPNRLSARSRTRTLPGPGKKTVDIRGSPDRKDRFFYGCTINVYSKEV